MCMCILQASVDDRSSVVVSLQCTIQMPILETADDLRSERVKHESFSFDAAVACGQFEFTIDAYQSIASKSPTMLQIYSYFFFFICLILRVFRYAVKYLNDRRWRRLVSILSSSRQRIAIQFIQFIQPKIRVNQNKTTINQDTGVRHIDPHTLISDE